MANLSAIETIQQSVEGSVKLGVPLKDLTTIKTGGEADIFISPANRRDLASIIDFLDKRGIKSFILGGGSGIIVRDGGIRGAVISLVASFGNFYLLDEEEGTTTFSAEAGMSLDAMVIATIQNSLTGYEFLHGIPGTVGGAIINNASAWGQAISDNILAVEVMDSEGEILYLDADGISFGEKICSLEKGHIILSATFRGTNSTEEEIKEKVRTTLTKRLSEQPVNIPTAGMIFYNPEGSDPAGMLIDQCGLKGIRVGDAEISPIHANFIVNNGEATAGQVIALIGMMQERVYVKHRIKLSTKVELVGSRQQEMLRITE